jgi:hypothetical protein
MPAVAPVSFCKLGGGVGSLGGLSGGRRMIREIEVVHAFLEPWSWAMTRMSQSEVVARSQYAVTCRHDALIAS